MKKNKKTDKTNAMRLLDNMKIDYSCSEYEYDESDLSGNHAATELNITENEIFKTLVTRGNDNNIYVFVIPVSDELDLKKAAKNAAVKKIEMIHVKEIEGLTGYIRGGCSPIGMKKEYKTFIDESIILLDKVYISAGKRGKQIIIKPEDLIKVTKSNTYNLCKD